MQRVWRPCNALQHVERIHRVRLIAIKQKHFCTTDTLPIYTEKHISESNSQGWICRWMRGGGVLTWASLKWPTPFTKFENSRGLNWWMCKRVRCAYSCFMGPPYDSYGTSPAIWDHTVLPAARHKWTRPALIPARRLVLDLYYLPRKDGRLSWLRWLGGCICSLQDLASFPTDRFPLRSCRLIFMDFLGRLGLGARTIHHIHHRHFIILHIDSWYSFYRSTEGRRLSWPRHCSKGHYSSPVCQCGLSVSRQSPIPIQVVTGPGVD